MTRVEVNVKYATCPKDVVGIVYGEGETDYDFFFFFTQCSFIHLVTVFFT